MIPDYDDFTLPPPVILITDGSGAPVNEPPSDGETRWKLRLNTEDFDT